MSLNSGKGWRLKPGVSLRDYQYVTYRQYLKTSRMPDWSEAGTGKSLPALCAILEKIAYGVTCVKGSSKYVKGGDPRNAVIFTPASARLSWLMDTWPLFEYTSADLVLYSGTKTQRERIRQETERARRPVIILVSWGLISTSKEGVDISWIINRVRPAYYLLDEAQYISGHESMRSITLTNMIRFPANCTDYPQIQFLSATPVTNGPEKAWPYLYLMYESIHDGSNTIYKHGMGEFYDKHFDTLVDRYSRERVVSFHHQEEFKRILTQRGVMHLRQDVFKNRKEPTFTVRGFDMDDTQAAIYWYLMDNLLINLPDGDAVEVKDAMSRMIRERQIATDPGIHGFEDCGQNKTKLLFEVLDEYGFTPNKLSPNKLHDTVDKCVIFVEFRHTYKKLERMLKEAGYGVVGILGGDSLKHREKAIERFNTDPMTAVFLGSRNSMAEGLNLQRANVVINYEIGWALDKYIQANGRIDRMGQNKHIHYINIVAQDTIDVYIIRKLQQRENLSDSILNELKERTKKHRRKFKKLTEEMKIRILKLAEEEKK